jgi:hypothetical protein
LGVFAQPPKKVYSRVQTVWLRCGDGTASGRLCPTELTRA